MSLSSKVAEVQAAFGRRSTTGDSVSWVCNLQGVPTFGEYLLIQSSSALATEAKDYKKKGRWVYANVNTSDKWHAFEAACTEHGYDISTREKRRQLTSDQAYIALRESIMGKAHDSKIKLGPRTKDTAHMDKIVGEMANWETAVQGHEEWLVDLFVTRIKNTRHWETIAPEYEHRIASAAATKGSDTQAAATCIATGVRHIIRSGTNPTDCIFVRPDRVYSLFTKRTAKYILSRLGSLARGRETSVGVAAQAAIEAWSTRNASNMTVDTGVATALVLSRQLVVYTEAAYLFRSDDEFTEFARDTCAKLTHT